MRYKNNSLTAMLHDLVKHMLRHFYFAKKGPDMEKIIPTGHPFFSVVRFTRFTCNA